MADQAVPIAAAVGFQMRFTALCGLRTLQGVFDPRCTALAELHSRAVDFPKTGVVVEVSRELRPTRFPDFMQNKQKEAYPSQTIIGRLYREIKVRLAQGPRIAVQLTFQACVAVCLRHKSLPLQDPAVQEVFPAKNDNKSFDNDLLVNGYQDYLDQAQVIPRALQYHIF